MSRVAPTQSRRLSAQLALGPHPLPSIGIRTAALAPLGERVAIPQSRESRVRGQHRRTRRRLPFKII